MRTVFNEMLPSISNKCSNSNISPKCSPSLTKGPKTRTRTKTKKCWIKVCTVILGAACFALLFASTFLLVQNYFGHPKQVVRDIVFYERRPHPKISLLNYYDPSLSKGDVHISVKTTKINHAIRVGVILKTWYQHARDTTYFVTDSEDEQLSYLTDNKLVVTKCKSTHSNDGLNCKMNAELDVYLNSKPMKK